jgi:hypothetical protein
MRCRHRASALGSLRNKRIVRAVGAHPHGTPLPRVGEIAERSEAGERASTSTVRLASPSPGASRRPLPRAGEVYRVARIDWSGYFAANS